MATRKTVGITLPEMLQNATDQRPVLNPTATGVPLAQAQANAIKNTNSDV